jgi:hypothetical protein
MLRIFAALELKGLPAMKIFHCGNCDQLLFFENTSCLKCGHALAYLPELGVMGTFEREGYGAGRLLAPLGHEREYRCCANYDPGREGVCNWAVAAADGNVYCRSCRLTRVFPDLSLPGTRAGWARLEAAKRRLVYSLMSLDLPLANQSEDPERGLAFEFLADAPPGTPAATPVLTGHENGVITVNVAEADDAERERRRLQMHEPYRTILGHFRHEIGHYYWDRLIKDTDAIEGFRRLFGDERQDYSQALQRHHQQGPPPDWPQRFVSAYASSHPWEDWAESWAHYLHIIDCLETAEDSGLMLSPKRRNEPALKPNDAAARPRRAPFDQLIESWIPLTLVLNNLNRSMGLQDGYPFVLSPPALDKLRFIHEIISHQGQNGHPDRSSMAAAG